MVSPRVPDLDSLSLLLEIAMTGSLGRAGAAHGISQPAVSNHLRVLRDSGFARSASAGSRRIYSLSGERITEVQSWAAEQLRFWGNRLDALDTELHRQAEET